MAMKVVLVCEKPREADKKLQSVDDRIRKLL